MSLATAAAPGHTTPGLIHPGLIGTAPSAELLEIWNEREGALVKGGAESVTLGGVLHTRPLGALGAVAWHNCLRDHNGLAAALHRLTSLRRPCMPARTHACSVPA